ncbi:MAG: formate dehydrogenase-N subunit alpha [Candidatus Firestonebacteria bacterium]
MKTSKISRKEFLKLGGSLSAFALSGFNFLDIYGNQPPIPIDRLKYAKESTSICSFCGGGCGQIVHTENGKIVNIEGDPDHPVNEGALCSKSNASYQIVNNERRLRKVLYRAPNSNQWEEKTVDWAIKEIAKRVKSVRNNNFITTEDGVTVNRTEAIASIGGAALDNEECYLISKLTRALGIVFFEHEARLCHSSTVAALGHSFGRGAMTNHWVDVKNADCILVIGANPVENHVVAAKWIDVAKENGAKLIVCDPRFTRTSAIADLCIQHRAGTDIALIGYMINYCLENKLYHEEYVREYTNASFLINPEFNFNDGLFNGYDATKKVYNAATWDYQAVDGIPKKDMTLSDPNCVFQLLKKHFSRYTPNKASKITGVPTDKLVELAKTYCKTGKPGKSGTILYAMGATQHTTGTEYIRGYAILQLLLGNMGMPGGGINAMRGESNVQGSTDFGLLFHLLPGYLGITNAKLHPDLKSYLEKETPKTSYWSNKPKFFISLLKAWWGDRATKENDYCYDYLPKIGTGHKNGGYSWIALFEAMKEGVIKGLLNWGMNPAVSGANSNLELNALDNLDWLVDIQLWETETGNFWQRPGVNPSDIKTEVFVLPASFALEKEGSISNSGRWIQWRYQAIDSQGDAKRDLWWLDRLYKELKALYVADKKAIFPDPIINLNWNYGDEPDVHLVSKEINGYSVENKQQLLNFTKLADDGSTACGCWIYSGFYPGADKKDNKSTGRDKSDPSGLGLFPGWSYAWPVNRRIIYNRCSADVKGNPYNPKKTLVKWNAVDKKWITNDVPDFGWKDAKTGEMIPPEKSAAAPFIMLPELHARLFVIKGATKEGPFPEHYEPFESPVKNLLSSQQINPIIKIWDGEFNKKAEVGSKEYPIIGITFRLTEHWQSGIITRNLPWLAELMPEMFVEISPELAQEKGIQDKEWVKVVSIRGEVLARACITSRLAQYQVDGKKHEMIGVPWHFGFRGYVTGGKDRNKNYAANQLTAHVGDGNTMIPEYKVFLCDVRKI